MNSGLKYDCEIQNIECDKYCVSEIVNFNERSKNLRK